MEILQKFTTPDGAQFDTKAEAMDHLRRPKILAALMVITSGNEALSEYLMNEQETVESAFETGTIKRVTKADKRKLDKALDALVEMETTPDLKFLVDNVEAMRESFRWPSVKRMTEEEKATAARNTLLASAEGNEELVTWILASKDQILEAYKAGIVKRKVNQKATDALAEYRAKKAAEKAAAAEAAEAAEA